MFITKVEIPIYFGTIVIILTEDFKKVDEVYNTKIEGNSYDAVVFDVGEECIVALKSICWSVIAHEVVHIVNSIYLRCNILLDRENDEPQAYLTGWIINEIEQFVNECNYRKSK